MVIANGLRQVLDKDSLYLLLLRQVPMLVPGVAHCVETLVNSVSELGVADIVRVLVVKDNNPKPVLTALINMPVADTVAQS